ncbi:MAG: DNA alkylation repair protein, partial [Longimicrobiales bacterium]
MPKNNAAALLADLKARADPVHAAALQRFFRTGPGDYGAGDRFLCVRVPVLRSLARDYPAMPLTEAHTLLRSPLHEARLMALFLMLRLYDRGDAAQRAQVYRAYLDDRAHINNWDLVDSCAPHIVGRHLFDGAAAQERSADDDVLPTLAASAVLWDRRIAIVATQYFIRQGNFDQTMRLATLLLHDQHDLIHKAVGWMLREVGNRDREREEVFLRAHAATMPRTMLPTRSRNSRRHYGTDTWEGNRIEVEVPELRERNFELQLR